MNFKLQADNPKISGPRLCALRIQNGTSNILLDNIESTEASPVVYRRRSRFLDEELDENKDVITSCDRDTSGRTSGGGNSISGRSIDRTSKISMLMSSGVRPTTPAVQMHELKSDLETVKIGDESKQEQQQQQKSPIEPSFSAIGITFRVGYKT